MFQLIWYDGYIFVIFYSLIYGLYSLVFFNHLWYIFCMFQLNIPPKTSLSACTDSSRAILHDSPFPTGMAIPYLARIGNLGESLYATSPMTPNALGVEPSAFYPLVSFNFHTYKIKFQWYQIMGPRVDSDSVEKIGRYSIMRGPDLSLFVSANLRDFSLFIIITCILC